MAFTFDCTQGGIDSNSYVCLGEADDYFAGDPRGANWDTLSDLQREQYLVRATNRLERESYGGTVNQNNGTQRLQWPRKWCVHRNQQDYEFTVVYPEGDYYWPFDTTPQPMKDATMELAYWYFLEYTEEPMFSRNDIDRMGSVSIGPLSAKLRRTKEAALPDEVLRALRSIGPNGWIGGGAMRLVR